MKKDIKAKPLRQWKASFSADEQYPHDRGILLAATSEDALKMLLGQGNNYLEEMMERLGDLATLSITEDYACLYATSNKQFSTRRVWIVKSL